MNFLIFIPAVSFCGLLFVSSYVFSARGGQPGRGGAGPLLGIALCILTVDLVKLLPGVESHLHTLFHWSTALWMLVGAAALNSVYLLLGRPRDRWFWLLLGGSVAAAAIQLLSDATYRTYVSTPIGPAPVRAGVQHALISLAPVGAVLLGLALMFRESRRDILSSQRRAYRLLLSAAVLVIVPIVAFTLVMPPMLEIRASNNFASSVLAVGVVAVIWIVGRHGVLHLSLEAVADSVFEDMREGVIVVGEGNRIRRMNRAACSLLQVRGMYAGTPIGALLPDIHGGRVRRDFGAGERDLLISRYSRIKSDTELSQTYVIRDETESRKARKVLRRSRDELEKVAADRTVRLRQAQRLEALATISGGIAKDFNTLLSQIMGYVTSAAGALEVSHPVREDLDEVLNATRRAREIVKQMLYFADSTSRHHPILDGAKLVKDTLKIAQISVPSNVRVQFAMATVDASLPGDPTRLHQAVLNLVTNALHAMESEGGVLFVGVEVETLRRDTPVASGTVAAGAYVVVTIKDTGGGIPDGVKAHIFEPFFTTKKQGKGTGIGLATVHRVVGEHGGGVDVESVEGQGTRFALYLPAHTGGEG